MHASPLWEFKEDSGVAFDEAWSPRSDRLAVAGLDQALHVWSAVSGEKVLTAPYPELLSCVSWSPDGRYLACGSSAGEVVVFDSASAAVVLRAAGHTDEVRSVAYSPDGRYVASGANDRTVRIWSDDLALVTVISAHADLVRSVAWSPDGRIVASGGHDKMVRAWDARTGEARGLLADHQSSITQVAYSPGGDFLASASADSTVRVWDLSARAYALVLDEFDRWWVEGISFSPDGRLLATIDQNGTIRVFHLGKRQVVLNMMAGMLNKTVSWSPDGHCLASGGIGSEQVWALRD